MVIGYESVGVVEEVGKDVNYLVFGDCVVLELGIFCWKCLFCREGFYNFCLEMLFFVIFLVYGFLVD